MSHSVLPVLESRPKAVHQRIESFGKRFGKAHLVLVYHAALPLALTPDLLYCLWANFQRDIHSQVLDIPWVAVADLLLSSFWNEVANELYEIDTAVRNVLLSRLKEDESFGQQRINELSDFLLAYVQPQLQSDDPDIRNLAQAQRWTALAYTRPSEAARELASALSMAYQQDRADLIRIASVVGSLAEPLAEFQLLLAYARGMANFARGDMEGAIAEFDKVRKWKSQAEIAGVSLSIPRQEELTTSPQPSQSDEPTPASKPNQAEKLKIPRTRVLALGTLVLVSIGSLAWVLFPKNPSSPNLQTSSTVASSPPSTPATSPIPSPSPASSLPSTPATSPIPSPSSASSLPSTPATSPIPSPSPASSLPSTPATSPIPSPSPASSLPSTPATSPIPSPSPASSLPSTPVVLPTLSPLPSPTGFDFSVPPSSSELPTTGSTTALPTPTQEISPSPQISSSPATPSPAPASSELRIPSPRSALPLSQSRSLMQLGDAGADVESLQQRLVELGYYPVSSKGLFDSETELAVKQFQRDYGLPVDGVVGSETLAALQNPPPPILPSPAQDSNLPLPSFQSPSTEPTTSPTPPFESPTPEADE